MSWGEAVRKMIAPALLAGPLVGALGALAILVLAFVASEGAGVGSIALLVLIVGLILGLLVATPLALVGGAAMLRMAAGDGRWAMWRAWAIAGFAIGGAAGLVFGLLTRDVENIAVISAFLAFLGLAGAMVCRRMLTRSVDALDVVDADIFA